MRQIEASEVKPGMKIRWDSGENTYQCKVDKVTPSIVPGVVILDATDGSQFRVGGTPQITVMSEPRPEEPTEFGARVVADGFPAVRLYDGEDEIDPENPPWRVRIGRDRWQDMLWHELVEDCSVTAIPDQDRTAPADTPEVPERIDEWPEDDTALRAYPWRDRDGDMWYSVSDSRNPWVVGFAARTGAFHPYPKRGPWTRIADA